MYIFCSKALTDALNIKKTESVNMRRICTTYHQVYLRRSRLLYWFSLEIVRRSNKGAYLIIRVSSNLFMVFPKAISMQEVLKSGSRHIL